MRIRIMNDVAFHYVFGRESRKYNLINLLNAILVKPGDPLIQDLTLEETEFKAETLEEKSCCLDIRAITSQNHHINIEVQLIDQANMEKRSIYYWSKLYTEQLAKGEEYSQLNKTIAINILDFVYLKTKKVHSIYKLLETETVDELSDVLEIHFLELPKLKPDLLDLDCSLTRWLLFLSDRTSDQLKEEIFMYDEHIQQANEDLSKLAMDKAARRQYELREKAARDYKSNISASHEKGRTEGISEGRIVGRKEGRIEGRKEGRLEGQKEGRIEGRTEASVEHAKKMLAKGLDDDLIKDITGLTQSELDTLK